MSKKDVVVLALAATTILVLGPAASAGPLLFPPETLSLGWQGGPPYQRDIYMDFSVDPVFPPNPSGIPGAVYSGADDPSLWSSDFVTMDGDVHWDQASGSIGILGGGMGTVLVHIDNWDRSWATKNVYAEVTIFSPTLFGENAFIGPSLNVPAGSTITSSEGSLVPLDPTHYLGTLWFQVQPNPPWEELSFVMYADPGYGIAIEDIHIVTQCVPAPGAVLLGALGAGLVAFLRRRRAF